ncbi:MAG: type I DNA topoisomerase [Paludibacteraceae bacterium]|nr:type I DNA topoisomerase [Paludibacteraceae bacterium]
MEKNLVIVESPAKAKTIEKFLGKDFHVMSSRGHIRDLSEHGIGIDFEHNYEPNYSISPDKKKLVSELKAAADKAQTVWLASDEDREGEAIAWHLNEVLQLKPETTRRIVFHEITKPAILKAIEQPRQIDLNLVDAQQARRVLDRIVGYELSPILWRKIKPSLSAGRVQSVAVRLIVEREREIQKFRPEASYRVTAQLTGTDAEGKACTFDAELDTRFQTKQEALDFLEHCKQAGLTVVDIQQKPAHRSPAPPFTTSTLQQEASRKLGLPVAQTMRIAQGLYESGLITYMRTDSVHLSQLAIGTSKAEIIKLAGEQYVKTRQFTTHTAGAQEAHEAIRPTYMDRQTISGTAQEQRLYDLIWKRTIASQMADAQVERTTISIQIDGQPHHFVANGETITFDGFLRVYIESTDNEPEAVQSGVLPHMKAGQRLEAAQVVAQERFTQSPARYTEASLVRKMEELGIGRPSTYAPTISTIQNRKYVEKGNRAGEKRKYNLLTLKGSKISDQTKEETVGSDKGKLLPTDIGIVVNDFLTEYFPDIMSYNFTADVEKTFDKIADGQEEWKSSIDRFYRHFHPEVEKTMENSERKVGERNLGTDPATGRPVSVKIGKFGVFVQIGAANDEKKPIFAPLKSGQSLETITLEEALELFKLPRNLGEHDGKAVDVGSGRFGPYVKYDGAYYSIPKADDPLKITLERAVEIIREKQEAERNKVISTFGDIQVINGRYGPYFTCNGVNYKIPKTLDAKSLTEEQCRALMTEQPDAGKKKRFTRRSRKA